MHKLTDELVRKEDYARFSENNVSFITFNYDRSFEYFFYEGLLNSFEGISKDEIKEQLQEIRIIHVFEQVAGLEWQDFDTKITYGRDINSVDNMEPLIENLRIVYEESENPELQEAHKIISEADRIFFLGFGYAKENLEALKVPEKLRRITNVYGTAWHFKPREIGDIITRLQHGDTRTHIKDMDCLELLREYL